MQRAFIAALAAAGLFAASQVAFANALAPSTGRPQAPQSSQTLPVKSGMGGQMGHPGGAIHGFSMRHGRMMGHGGVFTRNFHRHRHHHFIGGPFFGFGFGYDDPDWYGGESCYWSCRRDGHGPQYCRANAWEYCG